MNITISLWEMIIATTLGLFLLLGVVLVTDVETIKAKTFANEIIYISSLKSNDNTQITISTPSDLNTRSENNLIIVENKDSKKLIEKSYLGNTKLTQNGDLLIIN